MAFVQYPAVPVTAFAGSPLRVHPQAAGGVPVVHERGTALDATKAEAFASAERAHVAGLNRAHYEGTAYNTKMHARAGNDARFAQATARDDSEIQRLAGVMAVNQHIAATAQPHVLASPTAYGTTEVPVPHSIPPLMYY